MKLWPNVDWFTALDKMDSVSDAEANGLIILLNYAIYPKILPLKNFLSAALEIKNYSGISKALFFLRRRSNSSFSDLFFNGGMLVFSATIILWWP